MPIGHQKSLDIIIEECGKLEERCAGYRKELTASIAEIMVSESEHRVSSTNIQQQVKDKCEILGDFLFNNIP